MHPLSLEKLSIGVTLLFEVLLRDVLVQGWKILTKVQQVSVETQTQIIVATFAYYIRINSSNNTLFWVLEEDPNFILLFGLLNFELSLSLSCHNKNVSKIKYTINIIIFLWLLKWCQNRRHNWFYICIINIYFRLLYYFFIIYLRKLFTSIKICQIIIDIWLMIYTK